MKNIIDVSIVSVSYKVKDKLFKCISSIYDSKPKVNFEIIVVDNNEKDSLQKELKRKFPKVIYVKSERNLGFGAGNNLGVKHARGEYLFFLNPDTKVLKNAVDNLYSFLRNNKNAGIVSPVLFDKYINPLENQGYKELTPMRAFFSYSIFRKVFPDKTIYSNFNSQFWKKNPIKEVDTITGAALMIKKDTFNKVNGFDEDYFLYFEENDISKKVRELGYKLFVNSNSKIIHKVGQSTKSFGNRDKVFSKSRFLYFKKHYGLVKALFLNLIFSLNKSVLFLFLVAALGLFLRVYNISDGMRFIGDQGWFYISARDILINGNIPLVGITSSHTWLHQGPIWTYLLSIFLSIFNFKPVSGAYLTILFGTVSIILIYKVTAELFSKKTGLIAAILYSTSPLIIMFERMPFDPSIIPFFSIAYFYSLVKWIKGDSKYFPLTIFFLAVLYNLELATFTLFFPFVLIFLYGFYKQQKWVKEIINKKIITLSVLSFLIPMLPVLIYDFSHGFKQTIVFLGWTLYKSFNFLLHNNSGGLPTNLNLILNFIVTNLSNLILFKNPVLSVIIFSLSIIYLCYLSIKNKEKQTVTLLLLFFMIALGVLINQTPSDAYLPVIFPFIIIIIALFFNYLFSLSKIFILFLVLIVFVNSYFALVADKTSDLSDRIEAADKIITLTNGKEYNLIGIGQGSQFSSFTMNYEYLLWWKGHPVSHENKKLKIYISETKSGIIINK